jgi:cell division protein FtsI/penicillin-binding protein 2
VAGKTGTAQIADPRGGYLKDVTIGSFAGYAPADNPQFVMIVKIDQPKSVQFAEASAAPIFGDMAKFLLNYFQIRAERPIIEPALPPLPLTASSSAAASSTKR